MAAWLGISFDTLRTFEISEIEIGLNVPINMTCTEMVHRIWGFTSKRYKLKESSSECREFVLACHTVKICNGIDEINGNVLIRRNILRVAFLSGDGRRSVLDRLKAGTLGELFDGYYIRAVNYFWRSCREFLFDTLGRRPSFRLKRGNLKELTDFILMLGLASYPIPNWKAMQGCCRKRLNVILESGCEYTTSERKNIHAPTISLNFTRL